MSYIRDTNPFSELGTSLSSLQATTEYDSGMKTFLFPLIVVAASLPPGFSKQTVIEGFSGYETPLAQQGLRVGDGWSSSWSGNVKWGGLEDVDSGVEIGNGNLEAPKGYVYFPYSNKNPGHASNFGPGLARKLQNPIPLNQDGVFYISCLWSQSGSGEFGTMQLSLLSDKTHSRKPFVITTQSSRIRLGVGNGEQTAGEKDFKPGIPHLLVVKVVAFQDPNKADEIYASVWSREERITGEPELWHMHGNVVPEDRDRVLNRFYGAGSANNTQRLDEIRIGSDFGSVTGTSTR